MKLEEWLNKTPALALKALAGLPQAYKAGREQVTAMILSDPEARARALESKRIEETSTSTSNSYPRTLNARRLRD